MIERNFLIIIKNGLKKNNKDNLKSKSKKHNRNNKVKKLINYNKLNNNFNRENL